MNQSANKVKFKSVDELCSYISSLEDELEDELSQLRVEHSEIIDGLFYEIAFLKSIIGSKFPITLIYNYSNPLHDRIEEVTDE